MTRGSTFGVGSIRRGVRIQLAPRLRQEHIGSKPITRSLGAWLLSLRHVFPRLGALSSFRTSPPFEGSAHDADESFAEPKPIPCWGSALEPLYDPASRTEWLRRCGVETL